MYQAIIFAIGWICLALIRLYRFLVSPFLGNCCRFYPTCSQYAEEAFKTHRLLKAFYLSGWRILRCHPLNKGGIDPVPRQ